MFGAELLDESMLQFRHMELGKALLIPVIVMTWTGQEPPEKPWTCMSFCPEITKLQGPQIPWERQARKLLRPRRLPAAQMSGEVRRAPTCRCVGLQEASFLSLHQLEAASSFVAPGERQFLSGPQTAQSVVKLSEAIGATPALARD